MPKKRKRGSIAILKDKAWKLLSHAIRLEAADPNGYVSCVTCGTTKPWQEMEAGHFVPGRGNSILFDERGIYCQCSRCNRMEGGNLPHYFEYMRSQQGLAVINELMTLARQPRRLYKPELHAMIEQYQDRIDQCKEVR